MLTAFVGSSSRFRIARGCDQLARGLVVAKRFGTLPRSLALERGLRVAGEPSRRANSRCDGVESVWCSATGRAARTMADFGGSVEPRELAPDLAELRVHPLEIEAPPLQQLIPRAAELDQNDPIVRHRLDFLPRQTLAQVITVHAVGTELLEKEPWDFAAIYYECIDQTSHGFMPFPPTTIT